MLIAFLVIIGLSFLILAHEAGHFFVAKLFKMRVDEFGFGFPPRIFAWRPKRKVKEGETLRQAQGETEYSINWLPFGGFVKIAGENAAPSEGASLAPGERGELSRYFFAQPAWRRSLVILAGVTINFVLGWLLLSIAFMIGTPRAVLVGGIQSNSPAAIAGFKEGDVLLGFSSNAEFIDYVNQRKGQEIYFPIQRDGKEMKIVATPRLNAPEGQGSLGVLLAEAGSEKRGVFSALADGFIQSVALIKYTFYGLVQIVGQLIRTGTVMEGVVGPVGIFTVAQQAGQIGLVYLLQLMSLISINLAVINCIPFPALDGGRFVMIVIEKIKGSPIPRRIEQWINVVGFMALILLMVLITVNDVSKWF